MGAKERRLRFNEVNFLNLFTLLAYLNEVLSLDWGNSLYFHQGVRFKASLTLD